MTITEFLEARIAEDEAQAHNVLVFRMNPETNLPGNQAIPARARAECAAKRAIVSEHMFVNRSHNNGEWETEECVICDDPPYPCDTLRHIAAIYADHPDYRQEWAL